MVALRSSLAVDAHEMLGKLGRTRQLLDQVFGILVVSLEGVAPLNGQRWLLCSEHLEATPIDSVLCTADEQPSDALAPQSCAGRLGRDVHALRDGEPAAQSSSCSSYTGTHTLAWASPVAFSSPEHTG